MTVSISIQNIFQMDSGGFSLPQRPIIHHIPQEYFLDKYFPYMFDKCIYFVKRSGCHWNIYLSVFSKKKRIKVNGKSYKKGRCHCCMYNLLRLEK